MQNNKNHSFVNHYYGETTDADIEVALKRDFDVISAIIEGSKTEEYNESRELLKFYLRANAKDRATLDQMMVYLCGWTMHNLIEREIPAPLRKEQVAKKGGMVR